MIAEFAERPHILLQTSKGWQLNVSTLLFQGYEKEPDLKLYVDRAKAAHPDESAYVLRAAAVVRGVLKDASGNPDGRGARFLSHSLHPPYLAQIAEYLSIDLCSYIRSATSTMHGESIISFANNLLKGAASDGPEKAEKIRRWLPEHTAILQTKTGHIPTPCGLCFLPPEITYFSKITRLTIAGCTLSFVPSCIGNLTELVELNLYRNRLSFLPPEIGNLTKLKFLWVFKNQLSSLPVELSALKALEELLVEDNPFTSIPHALRKTGVETIDKALSRLPEEAFVPPTCWESFCDAFWDVWASVVAWFDQLLWDCFGR